MRAAASSTASAGFLLPETLATFTISAAVLFCLVSGSAMLMMVSDRAIDHVQTNDRFYQAIHALARDLAHIARARWNGEEPQPYIFSGDEHALLFTVEDEGPLYTTRRVISLRPQGRDGDMTWREAELRPMAAQMDDLRFGAPHLLDLAGARLRFAYVESTSAPAAGPGEANKTDAKPIPDAKPADAARRPNRDVVHKGWPSKRALPDAILVEADDAQTGRPLASLRINLMINADIGCIKPEVGAGTPGPTPTGAPTPQPGDVPPPVVLDGTSPGGGPTPPPPGGGNGTPGAGPAGAPGGDTFCSRSVQETQAPQTPPSPNPGAPK